MREIVRMSREAYEAGRPLDYNVDIEIIDEAGKAVAFVSAGCGPCSCEDDEVCVMCMGEVLVERDEARREHDQMKVATHLAAADYQDAMTQAKRAEAERDAFSFEHNRYRECAKELRTAVKALEHRICTGRGMMLDCLSVTESALERSRWLDDEAIS